MVFFLSIVVPYDVFPPLSDFIGYVGITMMHDASGFSLEFHRYGYRFWIQ